MKRILSTIVPIAIFAGLMATYFVPSVLAQDQLRLDFPWPTLIGLASLCSVLYVLYRRLIHYQLKERTVLATRQTPVFGEVRTFVDHWEASVIVSEGGPSIEIWGEALQPNITQIATFTAIRERFPELLQRTLEAALQFLHSLDISLSSDDLQLDGIYLKAADFGSFDLNFSTPTLEREIPWGLTAIFDDFSVTEISDNH